MLNQSTQSFVRATAAAPPPAGATQELKYTGLVGTREDVTQGAAPRAEASSPGAGLIGCVARVLELSSRDAEGWLGGLCREVRSMLEEAASTGVARPMLGVWAAVIGAGGSRGTGGAGGGGGGVWSLPGDAGVAGHAGGRSRRASRPWTVLSMHVTGYPHESIRQAVADDLVQGGAMCLESVAVSEGGPMVPGAGPGACGAGELSRGRAGSGGLGDTPGSRWRRSLNLAGWARLSEPVRPDNGGSARTLVLHVDASEAATPVEMEPLLALLAPMGKCLAAAYELAAGAAAERQGRLMARVSVTQRPILKLLVTGMNESEIARCIHRSPHTVHDHIKSIYAALGVSSRFELLQAWVGMSRSEPARPAAGVG